MLKKAKLDINASYRNSIIESTAKQAVLYSKFMTPEKKNDYSLTDTEKNVYKLICDGFTNEEISKLLGVSQRTVKFHLTNIYSKLEVKNRVGAVNLAHDENLF